MLKLFGLPLEDFVEVQGWVRQGPSETMLPASLWMVTYLGRGISPPSFMSFSSTLSILCPQAQTYSPSQSTLPSWPREMKARGQTDGWAILAT